jgi:hypothetical protein
MPFSTQSYHRIVKEKLEEAFLDVLQCNIDEPLRELNENNPLIKNERQMKMEPIYSPTCDVAVGPFSFQEGNLNDVYCNLARLGEIERFVRNLQEISLGSGYNEVLLDLNNNPRCFIAIEVENTTTKDVKHLLGSITNCSLLGKIGITIIFDEYLHYAERLLAYLAFVKRVKKTSKDLFRNVFVVPKSRIDRLLQFPE